MRGEFCKVLLRPYVPFWTGLFTSIVLTVVFTRELVPELITPDWPRQRSDWLFRFKWTDLDKNLKCTRR